MSGVILKAMLVMPSGANRFWARYWPSRLPLAASTILPAQSMPMP